MRPLPAPGSRPPLYPGFIAPGFDPRLLATATPEAANLPVLLSVALMASAIFGSALPNFSGFLLTEIDLQQSWVIVYVIWAVAAVLLFVSAQIAEPALAARRTPMVIAVGAFVLLYVFCTTLVGLSGKRPDFVDVGRQTAMVLYATLPFFALAYAARRMDPTRAVIVVCHCVLGISLVSIGLDFVGLTSFESGGNRFFGFLGDGVAWILTLPLIIYFASGRFVPAAITAVALLLGASRGPSLVVAVALLLLFLFSPGRRLQYFVSTALMAGIVIYQADQVSTLIDRFASVEISSNDRVITSINGLQAFNLSPVYGSGYGSLNFYFPVFRQTVLRGEFGVAVSTFVQMLSDVGVIGFLGYATLVLTTTLSSIKLVRASRGGNAILGGLIAWLIAFLWMNQSAAWLLAGSNVAPLVLGVAGIVAGSWSRWKDLGSASLTTAVDERAA